MTSTSAKLALGLPLLVSWGIAGLLFFYILDFSGLSRSDLPKGLVVWFVGAVVVQTTVCIGLWRAGRWPLMAKASSAETESVEP